VSGPRVLAGVAVLALVAAGCTIGGGDEVVTVLVSGDPAELQAYRDVAAAFERGDPGIDVRLIEVAERDDLILRLSTSVAAGDPPDLFLLNYRYYGQFAANGSLEPVEPYLADSGALSADDFYPEAMDPFRFGGVQTCLPQNVSSLVVYYNRDLFEAAGVTVPADGWEWRQMVARATELTRDDDGDGTVDVYGLGVDPEIIRVAPLVWSNGAELVDDTERPTRFTLSDPAATEAVQLFLDLRALHAVVPTDEEAESRDLESRFLDGQLAMLMESRRVTPTLRTITDFRWDVAPLPVLERPAGILHSDAYCMTAASDHHDAAWRYLEFALGPEGQRIAAETGRTVPSLVDVANSDAFLDPGRAPVSSQVFLDAIPVIRAVPHVSTWPEIEDAANALLEEAFYGEGSAAEVVAQIERVTEPLFARAES
jgi:multiple sugar transport system substrate-binding protein